MSKQPNVMDFYNYIDQIAPFDTAETWDNVGLLIGDYQAPVSKVLLSLDITEAVVAEAIDGQFNLIITHHPIIFTGIKSITNNDRIGKMLVNLIQHKISVIAAHTNLDRSFENGINHMIADYYHLQSVEPLNAELRFGIVGNLPVEMTFDRFIEHTKAVFDIAIVKVSNTSDPDNPRTTKAIRKVALSSGASSDFIRDAIASNADVYITADLKYHEAQTVIGTDLILIDVGHFESESIYLMPFKIKLLEFATTEKFQIEVHATRSEKPVFNYL